MRVMVTGGAGFIGSHIVDLLLQRGHEVAVLDNLETGSRDNVPAAVPLYEVDIRDQAGVAGVFDRFRPEAVCHQAAQMSVSRSVREPAYDAQVNVLGLLNVLDNSVRLGAARIVFASSGGVLYGDVAKPAPEDTPASPISPYGISKWVGERYLEFYVREHGITAVALRYSNVYGPRQNPLGEAGVVAIFCTRMLAGQSATINGDGCYVRDYVYVADVARANVLALEKQADEPFVPLNIGTSLGTDVNQLGAALREQCQQARRAAGRSGDVPALEHGPARPGDLRSNLISVARADRILGWRPEVRLPQGLQQTVEWFARR
jgi:UDP-glucose 4-epimerase